jgi:hypothetical protein
VSALRAIAGCGLRGRRDARAKAPSRIPETIGNDWKRLRKRLKTSHLRPSLCAATSGNGHRTGTGRGIKGRGINSKGWIGVVFPTLASKFPDKGRSLTRYANPSAPRVTSPRKNDRFAVRDECPLAGFAWMVTAIPPTPFWANKLRLACQARHELVPPERTIASRYVVPANEHIYVGRGGKPREYGLFVMGFGLPGAPPVTFPRWDDHFAICGACECRGGSVRMAGPGHTTPIRISGGFAQYPPIPLESADCGLRNEMQADSTHQTGRTPRTHPGLCQRTAFSAHGSVCHGQDWRPTA